MFKLRKYVFHIGVIALAIAGLSAFSGIAFADDPPPPGQGQEQEAPEHEEDIDTGIVRQTPDDTPNPDNVFFAEETGLSIEEIDRVLAIQEEFGQYAKELLDQHPGHISAIWMDNPPGTTGPNTRGHVRFVGSVPSDIEIKENVVVTGDGLISLADHKLRTGLVAEALRGLGYNNFGAGYIPEANAVQIEFLIPDGTTQPSKSAIIPVLRQQLKTETQLQGRSAFMEAGDIDLTVLTGSGPLFELTHSRGGNWLRDDGRRECTSGWSVDGPNGTGIITAGHCTGLNEFEQPGVNPYSMTWRSQVINTLGDVEYHTTSHVELPEFYATATQIRDVDGIRATDTMVGHSICFYGRKSNDRMCNIEIVAVDYEITTVEGYTLGNMALTEPGTSIVKGDSGGGWSMGYTAWGVQSSVNTQGRALFTPVEEAQDALYVTIRTQ